MNVNVETLNEHYVIIFHHWLFPPLPNPIHPQYLWIASPFEIALYALTGSILGGDAEKYFMIDLRMEKHMSLDLPCLG